MSKPPAFEAPTFEAPTAWGEHPFRIVDEELLQRQYNGKLRDLDKALPLYTNLVKDLRAIAAERKIKVVYALQPEGVALHLTVVTNTSVRSGVAEHAMDAHAASVESSEAAAHETTVVRASSSNGP